MEGPSCDKTESTTASWFNWLVDPKLEEDPDPVAPKPVAPKLDDPKFDPIPDVEWDSKLLCSDEDDD